MSSTVDWKCWFAEYAIVKFNEQRPDHVDNFFSDFCQKLIVEGNGNIVDCIPVLSYATGLHNNALILGSSEQSKAAFSMSQTTLPRTKSLLNNAWLSYRRQKNT
jgi:hypothetical protein